MDTMTYTPAEMTLRAYKAVRYVGESHSLFGYAKMGEFGVPRTTTFSYLWVSAAAAALGDEFIDRVESYGTAMAKVDDGSCSPSDITNYLEAQLRDDLKVTFTLPVVSMLLDPGDLDMTWTLYTELGLYNRDHRVPGMPQNETSQTAYEGVKAMLERFLPVLWGEYVRAFQLYVL